MSILARAFVWAAVLTFALAGGVMVAFATATFMVEPNLLTFTILALGLNAYLALIVAVVER